MQRESKIIEEEKLELIAIRKPPGDNWTLVNDRRSIVHKSLTDTLEAWFGETSEQVSFRLDPLDSKLYAIRTEQVEIKPEPIKTFSIYGEYSANNKQ